MAEDLTDDEIAAFRARLLARRDELAALDVATGEDRRPVELDQTRVGRLSRMDAIQMQAMAAATAARRAAELRRVEAALARIGEGEYGWCAACGDPVALARLDLDPALPTCIGCARKGGG